MILLGFLLALFALLLQTSMCFPFVLLVFAPWISLLLLSTPLSQALFLASFAGAILDLLCDDPMGVHALNYTLSALFLSQFHRYFSYEHPLHLSLFTLFFSFVSTLLQLFLLFLFDRRVPFAGEWVLGDLFVMPIVDALYALLWFAFPLIAYKKGVKYWSQMKNRIYPT